MTSTVPATTPTCGSGCRGGGDPGGGDPGGGAVGMGGGRRPSGGDVGGERRPSSGAVVGPFGGDGVVAGRWAASSTRRRVVRGRSGTAVLDRWSTTGPGNRRSSRAANSGRSSTSGAGGAV